MKIVYFCALVVAVVGLSYGHKGQRPPLTDKHRYLTIIGKRASEAQKLLGKGKPSNDGTSWSYLDYNVKPFDWFTIQTRWNKAPDAEWRKSPERATIRVQVKPRPMKQLFDELGFAVSEWKEMPYDPKVQLAHIFHAGEYEIRVSPPWGNAKDLDIMIGKR